MTAGALQALLQPAALGGVGDVHEFAADAAAVSRAADGDDLGQTEAFRRCQCSGMKSRVEIGRTKAMECGIQIRHFGAFAETERVQLSALVPPYAECIDHAQDAGLLDILRRGRAGRMDCRIGSQPAKTLQSGEVAGILAHELGHVSRNHAMRALARAMGLSLLGEKLSAEEAERWGLIWKCVEDGVLLGEDSLFTVDASALREILKA